jgi:hypothetical protein
MAAFAITEAAQREIRSRLESSACERPTASLIDSSQTFTTPSDLVDAISNKATYSEMFEIAMKDYREREGTLDFRLEVGVYEADKCRPQDLVLLDGIQFAIPKEMREYFTDYVLDYASGYFLLKNGDLVFLRLMDLGKGEGSSV